jgi:hypothetical protein
MVINETVWRAGEVELSEGSITIDVAGSGKLARIYLRYENKGTTQDIHSLEDLARVLSNSNTDRARLAQSNPEGFTYLLCYLSGRRHYAPVREFMWPELESRYGLKKAEHQPRVIGGTFGITVYHFEGEDRIISRLKVDLVTLGIVEEEIVGGNRESASGVRAM